MNQYQMNEMQSVQHDPHGYEEYMKAYGCHFSKKMCQWAVGMMKTEERNGEKKKLAAWSKEQVEEMLARFGVTLDNDKGYDKVYVANMCKADFFKKSVIDEAHVAMYVKDLLDDPDGYESIAFSRFVMDCMEKNVPIIWEDML